MAGNHNLILRAAVCGGLCMGLVVLTGCPTLNIDEVQANVAPFPAGNNAGNGASNNSGANFDSGNTGLGAASRSGDLRDGSSNTVQVGESNAPADATPRGGDSVSAPVDARPDSSGSAADDVSTGGGAPAVGDPAIDDPPNDADAVREVTALFADKQFEFGNASFFSSGSITVNNTLTLCGFGRFGMNVTRVTSTTFSDSSSEETLFGTWSIALGSNSAELVLNVDSASDPADVGIRRLPLSQNADGVLFIDGDRASAADATTICAQAQP